MKKKFLVLLLVAGFSTNAAAQFFVGGTGGVGYLNDAFRMAVKPMAGYEFDDRWAVGTTLGFSLVTHNGSEVFGVADPFVRFTCWNNSKLFVDLVAHSEMLFQSELYTANVGISPALRYSISSHWQLTGQAGIVGAQYDGADWYPAFGFTASTEVGVIYRF